MSSVLLTSSPVYMVPKWYKATRSIFDKVGHVEFDFVASVYRTLVSSVVNELSVTLCYATQYEQLNDLRVKFEDSLRRQDDSHSRYDLNLTADNLKVASLQAEEEAEAIAEQFLTGIIYITYLFPL